MSSVEKTAKQVIERASSALADVDTAKWTLRFDLLSDPNRLEILLCLHRAPGIASGIWPRRSDGLKRGIASASGASAAGLGEFHQSGPRGQLPARGRDRP